MTYDGGSPHSNYDWSVNAVNFWKGRGLPANTSRMAIGAVVGLIADEIEAGRTQQLPGLLPEVLFATLSPYLGPEAAARRLEEINEDVH